MPFTLPHALPPLRLLLVWDPPTGQRARPVCAVLARSCRCYTRWARSWLNMAESIERVLQERRALDGQHPHSPAELGAV